MVSHNRYRNLAKAKEGGIYSDIRGGVIKITKITPNRFYYRTAQTTLGQIIWGFEDWVTYKIMNEFLSYKVEVDEQLILRRQSRNREDMDKAREELRQLFSKGEN